MNTSTKRTEENCNKFGIDRKAILSILGLDKMIDQYVSQAKPNKKVKNVNANQYNGNKNKQSMNKDQSERIYSRPILTNKLHRNYQHNQQKTIKQKNIQAVQKRVKSQITLKQDNQRVDKPLKCKETVLYSTVYTQEEVKVQKEVPKTKYFNQSQLLNNNYMKARARMLYKTKNPSNKQLLQNKTGEFQKCASSLNSKNHCFKSKSKVTQSSNIIKIGQKQQIKNQRYVDFDTNYYNYSYKSRVKVPSKTTLDIQLHTKNKVEDQSQNKVHYTQSQREIISQKPIKQKQMKVSSTHKTLETYSKFKIPSSTIFNKKNHNLLLKGKQKLLKDRYELQKIIGRGMSGEVYKAKDILADRFIAIKIINSDSIQYQFLKEMSHPNIIQYFNSFIQKQKRYLVLQYFPMTLNTLLKQKNVRQILTEDKIKQIFRNVAQGLGYLHSISIAHRDVKLDNIVISQDLERVKFIDFGLCVDLSKNQQAVSKQFCGTLSYLPPQIVQNRPYQPKKADIWSLGILLYGLAIRRLPYKGKNQMDLFQKICKNKLVFPQYFSSQLKDLIQKMIQKDPNERLSINDVISHSWLN